MPIKIYIKCRMDQTSGNKGTIYNAYIKEASLFGKICDYGIILMSLIIMGLYLYEFFRKGDIENVEFIVSRFNAVALLYTILQLIRSYLNYASKNKFINAIFKFRNLIVVCLMVGLYKTLPLFLSNFDKDAPAYLFIDHSFSILLFCFLSQFLYSRTFVKNDYKFVIFLMSAILFPYLFCFLGFFKIPNAYRSFIFVISGVYIIASTIFDYKRPMISKKENIQMILVAAAMVLIFFNLYFYLAFIREIIEHNIKVGKVVSDA